MRNRAVIAMVICLLAQEALCYSTKTHKTITQHILDNNIISTTSYIKERLGYPDGADHKLTIPEIGAKSIKAWIYEAGSVDEDKKQRFVNHFLCPYFDNGCTGNGLWLSSILPVPVSSADVWATKEPGTQATFMTSPFFVENMSWRDAERYFRIGVTSFDESGNRVAFSSSEREAYLARAFKALGHVMHLAQDMAVPAHTRNDAHALPDPYEAWAKAKDDEIQEILKTTTFDYWWTTPKDTPVETESLLGTLARFSSYCFFSQDTICDPELPIPPGLTCHEVPGPYYPTIVYNPVTINKVLPNGDNAILELQAVPQTCISELESGDKFIGVIPGSDGIPPENFLTDEIHLAYAKILIPLAMNFSTKILDDFFKIEIDVTPHGDGLQGPLLPHGYWNTYSADGVTKTDYYGMSPAYTLFSGGFSGSSEWYPLIGGESDFCIFDRYLAGMSASTYSVYKNGTSVPDIYPDIIDYDLSVYPITPWTSIKDGLVLEIVKPRVGGCDLRTFSAAEVAVKTVKVYPYRGDDSNDTNLIGDYVPTRIGPNKYVVTNLDTGGYSVLQLKATVDIPAYSSFSYQNNLELYSTYSELFQDFSSQVVTQNPNIYDFRGEYYNNNSLYVHFRSGTPEEFFSDGSIHFNKSCSLVENQGQHSFHLYLQNHAAYYTANNMPLDATSRFMFGYTGNTIPFTLSFSLINSETQEDVYFTTNNATSIDGKTLGELFPDKFLNDEKYISKFTPEGFHFYFYCNSSTQPDFVITHFGLLPH